MKSTLLFAGWSESAYCAFKWSSMENKIIKQMYNFEPDQAPIFKKFKPDRAPIPKPIRKLRPDLQFLAIVHKSLGTTKSISKSCSKVVPELLRNFSLLPFQVTVHRFYE